jgi:hypothetical protein
VSVTWRLGAVPDGCSRGLQRCSAARRDNPALATDVRHRLAFDPVLKTDSARSRRIGIGLIVAGTVCFSIIDASGKWLVQQLPVAEVVWLRFATHVLWMALLLAPSRGWDMVRTRARRSCRRCAR